MKRIISILIVLMLTLSGCVSMTEVDEDKVKDVSDKLTKAIINSVDKENAERQESHKIEAKNLSKLNIKSSVGDISIATHDSSEAIINVNIIAKSNSKERAQELADNFSYSVKENWDTINIDTSLKDVKVLKDDNIQTKLSISIPKNIENFVISLNVGEINIKNTDGSFVIDNNVGNIEINNSIGSFDLKSDVGKIILKSCTPLNKTELKTNTGDIKAVFGDISKARTIKAETGVGNIEIATPDGSRYAAEIDEFMKDKVVVTGKNISDTKIELKTGVGNINFK